MGCDRAGDVKVLITGLGWGHRLLPLASSIPAQVRLEAKSSLIEEEYPALDQEISGDF
jgi:hypothetical protein